MNALFLKDLAAKTWRSLRGRAERGKSGDRSNASCSPPGAKRERMDATLHGDLGAVLEWTARDAKGNGTGAPAPGMPVSVVAGARIGRDRYSLVAEMSGYHVVLN